MVLLLFAILLLPPPPPIPLEPPPPPRRTFHRFNNRNGGGVKDDDDDDGWDVDDVGGGMIIPTMGHSTTATIQPFAAATHPGRGERNGNSFVFIFTAFELVVLASLVVLCSINRVSYAFIRL